MTLQENINVFLGLSLVVGGVFAMTQLIKGYEAYFQYCYRIRRGLPPGDPTDGKLWLTWVFFFGCMIPIVNIFFIWILAGIYYENVKKLWKEQRKKK